MQTAHDTEYQKKEQCRHNDGPVLIAANPKVCERPPHESCMLLVFLLSSPPTALAPSKANTNYYDARLKSRNGFLSTLLCAVPPPPAAAAASIRRPRKSSPFTSHQFSVPRSKQPFSHWLRFAARSFHSTSSQHINPLKPELNSVCYLLALLAHHFLHVSMIKVKSLTFRLLMSYIYIYIYIYIWSTHS